MKHAIVLALIAAAALAEEPGLSVRVELPVETLSEGERAVAKFRLKNEGATPIVLLDIEPDDGIETRGGVSEALHESMAKVDTAGGTIFVRTSSPQAAQSPGLSSGVSPLDVLKPGTETEREVVFKAPSGHVYAVHFAVQYVSLERAVADGAVYDLHTEEDDILVYTRVETSEAIREPALIHIEGLGAVHAAHSAIAVEVKPREFSFAQAAQAAGVVPDAATWFEHRGLWALAAKGKTWLVGPETRIELQGDHVPLLSGVELAEKDTMAIPAQGDALAGFLREKGATDVSGKGDGSLLLVPVKDLPEVLQKADELGFTVTQGGWKKRE